jgi:hypothetical protein
MEQDFIGSKEQRLLDQAQAALRSLENRLIRFHRLSPGSAMPSFVREAQEVITFAESQIRYGYKFGTLHK